MPRVCTVCTHPDRAAIDAALVSGESAAALAARYRTKSARMALQRHRAEHLPTTLQRAQEATDVRQALDVVQQLKAINHASLAILAEARTLRDGDLALKAVDRIQKQIELQAKLLGELDDRPQINLLVAPEWLQLRGMLLLALQPYPEARSAVAARLVALEDSRAAG